VRSAALRFPFAEHICAHYSLLAILLAKGGDPQIDAAAIGRTANLRTALCWIGLRYVGARDVRRVSMRGDQIRPFSHYLLFENSQISTSA